MTTIPERLQDDFFYKLLENNLQICKKYNKILNIVAKLIINIPYKFNKTQESYIITDKLKQLQKKYGFIINRCNDEGPITKILPTIRLSRFIKDDDPIIVMDDDIWYREKFIYYLYKSYVMNTEAIHCYGSDIYGSTAIRGYTGYIGSRKIFSKLLDVSIPDSCYKIDDNFIETIFWLYKIPLIRVKYNNTDGWWCAIDKKKTDEHPKWRELNEEQVPGTMIKKCESDCIRLNKI